MKTPDDTDPTSVHASELGCSEPAPHSRFADELVPHLDALFAMAKRLTRSTTEAEDLVQDTVLKAMRSEDHYRPGTNLKAWLYRILTNTFINKHRRGGLERTVLEGPDSDPLVDGWVSASSMRQLRNPEEHALRPIVESEVQRALDELPTDFKLAVILCDVEEFTYEEIAKIMGCPVGTVMSRLHRGRRLLQRSLYSHAVAIGILPSEPMTNVSEPTDLNAFRAKKSRGAA